MKVAIILVGFISVICGLPSYIHVCHQKDPNLKQCVIDAANFAIPHVLKGDKEYGVPPLNPLKITKVDVDSGSSLKFSVKDLSLYGLETAKFTTWTIDMSKQFLHIELEFDYLEINGTYEMDGNILVLPIKGTGPMSLYLEKSKVEMDQTFEYFKKGDVVYTHSKNVTIRTNHENGKFKFDNLFNGDKVLGAQTNKFLNENWKDVFNEVAPSVHEVIAAIVKKIVNAFCEKAPYNEVFPTD